MLFICYPKCSTCQRAQKWLAEHQIKVDVRNIAINNPNIDEIRLWHELSGLPLNRFFNTSGKFYKEHDLKNQLPNMTEEEQYALLASDGMIIKRPLLISNSYCLVGFKEKEWESILISSWS